MSEEGVFSQIKRLVVGQPIPSHLAHHERLSRFTGLAVLSSDPLSSVAYATEEILRRSDSRRGRNPQLVGPHFIIKGALLFKPNVVVTSVPFHLRH